MQLLKAALAGLGVFFATSCAPMIEKSRSELLSELSAEKEQQNTRANVLLELIQNSEFGGDCLHNSMSNEHIEVFFSVKPDGSFSGIYWFPKDKKSICFDRFLNESVIRSDKRRPNRQVNVLMSFKQPIISLDET